MSKFYLFLVAIAQIGYLHAQKIDSVTILFDMTTIKGCFYFEKICFENYQKFKIYNQKKLEKEIEYQSGIIYSKQNYYNNGSPKMMCRYIGDTLFVNEYYENGIIASEETYIKKMPIIKVKQKIKGTKVIIQASYNQLFEDCSDINVYNSRDLDAGYFYEKISYRYYNKKGELKDPLDAPAYDEEFLKKM